MSDPLLEEDAPLWERFPGESDKAYAAFCAYRDMGRSRSIDKAYRGAIGEQEYSKRGDKRASSAWMKWNSRYKWRSRAEAYDEYLDRQDRKLRIEQRRQQEHVHMQELESFRKMQYEAAKGLYAIGVKFLKKNTERIDQLDLSELDAKQLANNMRAIAEAFTKAQVALAAAAGVEDLLEALEEKSE